MTSPAGLRGRHGAQPLGDGTVRFSVWAPNAEHVELVVDDTTHELHPEERGWFSVIVPAAAGARYGYRLDGGDLRPDPASRRQPDGVHGLSAVMDPGALRWSDSEQHWRAPSIAAGAIYELHIGTFTAEGTFAAAAERLGHLVDLGVTHVEVMPVNAFNGKWGWGYDGVAWYAVHEPYGGPEGFVAFVDACHRLGLAVILDVVYNHLGPSGNYLPEFGPYLQTGRSSAWGDGINVDGPGSDAVRAFIIGNALQWLRDYHVDGLRLDAVHALHDTSAVHVLAELSEAVESLGRCTGRRYELIAESDRNDPQTVRPRQVGGLGLDAQWADDLHHAIHTALTGEDEGYYADYRGLPDVAEAYTRGFVYDGSRYSPGRGRTVGAPLVDVPGTRLVGCVQNHDQVGNRAQGERMAALVPPELDRLAAVLLCAAPHVPLLWMGEEHAETHPFQFFTSHPEPELGEAVRTGRAEEFAAFSSFAGTVPDPQDPETFQRSKIDWGKAENEAGRQRRALWRDLLALRRTHPALGNGRRDLIDLCEVSDEHLVLVRNDPESAPVLLSVNLGSEPCVHPSPEATAWTPLLSSTDSRYGGDGAMPRVVPGWDGGRERQADGIEVPPRCAVLWIPSG